MSTRSEQERAVRARHGGRGAVATADMKARILAGWTVADLWDRMQAAENGDGYIYDALQGSPTLTAAPVGRAARVQQGEKQQELESAAA